LVGGGVVVWLDLAQDRGRWRALINVIMNLQVQWNAWHFLTSWEPVSFSRMTLGLLSLSFFQCYLHSFTYLWHCAILMSCWHHR